MVSGKSQSSDLTFQLMAAAGFIGTLVTETPRPPVTPTPSAEVPLPAITFQVSCFLEMSKYYPSYYLLEFLTGRRGDHGSGRGRGFYRHPGARGHSGI